MQRRDIIKPPAPESLAIARLHTGQSILSLAKVGKTRWQNTKPTPKQASQKESWLGRELTYSLHNDPSASKLTIGAWN